MWERRSKIRWAKHVLQELFWIGLVVSIQEVLPGLGHKDGEDPSRSELHVHVLRVHQVSRVVR